MPFKKAHQLSNRLLACNIPIEFNCIELTSSICRLDRVRICERGEQCTLSDLLLFFFLKNPSHKLLFLSSRSITAYVVGGLDGDGLEGYGMAQGSSILPVGMGQCNDR